jgi:hypothetical protein
LVERLVWVQEVAGSNPVTLICLLEAYRVKALPRTKNALVLRTDFSSDAVWEAVCSEIRKPVGEFRAYVDCVSDASFAGLSIEKLVELAAKDQDRPFVFLVDEVTIADQEHPIVVVDLFTDLGRSFRVVPREMWGVENNLSIANMDFADFADNADDDGVFRGFQT